jgi:hypothetical protein
MIIQVRFFIAKPQTSRTHQVLESRDVHFESKPMLVAPMATHGLWLAEFRDPENNVLAPICEKPKAK